MKKSKMAMASVALASLGLGSLMYSYVKMHPIKAKAVAKDMKNVMKDLK
ncbi:MAG: hypothetical protein HFG33_00775 [Bacilli bacterium]|nr:hypothetical protein [Bacilli bacterium]